MAYHHLTPSERITIDSMRLAGYTQKAIAQALCRAQSTISREMARNGDPDGHYNPHTGNVLYWMRRRRLYQKTKRDNPSLMAFVEAQLAQAWSPEQIAGRLRYVHPQDPSRWVSHETIYRYVWADEAQGGTLYRTLRRGRRKYGKRGRGRHPNRLIKGRVSIDQRPPIVEQRGRWGDWEGDTFFGRHRQGCLVTLVERQSSFLAAATMPNAAAASLNAAVLKGFQGIPLALVHTITVDNGKEFARFKDLEKALDARFYFAHPYSAWERALNENTNGLLRQYFPKKTVLRTVTDEQLRQAVQCLNARPRKKLDYRTPSEVLAEIKIALDT